jgi:hypothetical protein
MMKSHSEVAGMDGTMDVTRAPQLIGLCGAAGSGKSTVANILERQGYVRLRFAGPLKAMLQALLTEAGMTAAEAARHIDGDLKEAPLDVLGGKTMRHAMQTLGKEWGRDLIHSEVWVRLTMAGAERLLAEGKRVVIDDVRFPNEAAAITGCELAHAQGAREMWRVAGRGGLGGAQHASETQRLPHDVTLDNSGDLVVLAAQIRSALGG